LDNEWLDSYNFIVDGFEATEETIAQELIESLGIGGVFMAEEHTVEHLRKSWWPSRIFNRLSFDVWDAKGKKDLLARSHELVEEYTAGYRTMEPVIADDTRVQLERIYAQARKSIVG